MDNELYINQYNRLVEQNRSLQLEVKNLKKENEQLQALKDTYLTCYKAKHEDINGELFVLRAREHILDKRFKAEEYLSKAEKKVMRLILMGYSNKQISKKLFIADSTVRTHIANIYQKLNVATTKAERKTNLTRLRAVLIYLGVAKIEDWES